MSLRITIPTVAILVTGWALACGASGDPTPQPTSQPPAASVQSQDTGRTPTPAPTGGEEEPSGPQPPPKDELIKFANWEDNSVKLVNWIVGYIVAHGLDRPVRIIDVEDGGYQAPLLQNDVDIVIAADGGWAEDQEGSGNVVRLDNASPIDPALTVVVHPSMAERALDVIELLEGLRIESDMLSKHSAMIRGGRVGLKENAVGLNFLKREHDVWAAWVSDAPAALVLQAIEDGKIGHCRQFINYAPDQMGNEGSRYCKDDPTKTSGNR